MVPAATLTPTRMSGIYEALPHYHSYFRRHAANADETEFRLEVGRQLQEMGQQLLDGAEARGHMLGQEQHDLVEMITEDLTTILRLLNRSGVIRMVDDPEITIPQLDTVDRQLILLLERLWADTGDLLDADGDRFQEVGADMAGCLAVFLDIAEERNRLLGLGWESEFGRLGLDRRETDGEDA